MNQPASCRLELAGCRSTTEGVWWVRCRSYARRLEQVMFQRLHRAPAVGRPPKDRGGAVAAEDTDHRTTRQSPPGSSPRPSAARQARIVIGN